MLTSVLTHSQTEPIFLAMLFLMRTNTLPCQILIKTPAHQPSQLYVQPTPYFLYSARLLTRPHSPKQLPPHQQAHQQYQSTPSSVLISTSPPRRRWAISFSGQCLTVDHQPSRYVFSSLFFFTASLSHIIAHNFFTSSLDNQPHHH